MCTKFNIFLVFLLLGLVVAGPLYAQTLNDVFTREDTLVYMGYKVTRSYDSKDNVWLATLKKEEKVLATFKRGGPLKEMTRFGLFPFLGKDTKQLIIEQYSGGAHCCWSYWIFNLLPNFEMIYDSQDYPVGYGLVPLDLDKDGVFEFTQEILTFDYFDRLCHALSPLPVVVFKYDEKRGKYFPANQMFPQYVLNGIEEDIGRVRKLKEKINFTTYNDSRGNYLSAVLEVVLRYIYAGKEKEGWLFYDEEYNLPDKERIKSKIKKKLKSCVIYREIYNR